MARIPRVVVPGIPHHVTQRGNRRQETFFCNEDYQAYLEIMANWCSRCKVDIWAYCLMPNHVHMIAVPRNGDSLWRAIGETHRRYTLRINFRRGWRGHLWQGRFASYPMDETYALAAARYMELNPVRAGLAETPEAYRWSSARAHLAGKNDSLVKVAGLLDIVGDWRKFLSSPTPDQELKKIRRHERTGRPLGNADFIADLEGILDRVLRCRKPGPKRKVENQ